MLRFVRSLFTVSCSLALWRYGTLRRGTAHRRAVRRLPVCLLVAILLLVTLPPAGQTFAADGDWAMQDIANAAYWPLPAFAISPTGTPVVAYWSVTRTFHVLRKRGVWEDLKPEISCDYLRSSRMALAISATNDIHLVYVCESYSFLGERLRYAFYDNAKGEWMDEEVYNPGNYMDLGGLSIYLDRGAYRPNISFSGHYTLYHARYDLIPEGWRVEVVTSTFDVFGNTSITNISGQVCIAFNYASLNEDAHRVGVATHSGEGWRTDSVAEGYLVSMIDCDALVFQEFGGLYYVKFWDNRWQPVLIILEMETPHVARTKREASEVPVFAFKRSGGIALASVYDTHMFPNEFGLRQIISSTSRTLQDFAMDDSGRAHVLLSDGGVSEGGLYYASGALPTWILIDDAKVKADGPGVWMNNRPLSTGTMTSTVEGDRMTLNPPSAAASLGADCVRGFVTFLALEMRPNLPPDYQQLGDVKIAFMFLLANPKLQSFLEEVCQENSGVASEAEEPYLILDMTSGALQVSPQHRDFVLEVRTPLVASCTTGNNRVVVGHDAEANKSLVWVVDGSATVTPVNPAHAPFVLNAGKQASIQTDGVLITDAPRECFLPVIRR